jgi:hypothetical protein
VSRPVLQPLAAGAAFAAGAAGVYISAIHVRATSRVDAEVFLGKGRDYDFTEIAPRLQELGRLGDPLPS